MRVLVFIVLLFLSAACAKVEGRLQGEARLARQPRDPSKLLGTNRILRWLTGIATWVFGLSGIVGLILEVWALVLSVSPEFHPGPDASHYTSPIIIRNDSPSFSMLNVQPNCLITHVDVALDPTQSGLQIAGSDTPLEHAAGRLTEVPFPKTDIGPNSPLNYRCDALPNWIPTDQATGRTKTELVNRVTFTIRLDYDIGFSHFSIHQTRYSQPITWQKIPSLDKDASLGRWQDGTNLDDVDKLTAAPFGNGPIKMGPFHY